MQLGIRLNYVTSSLSARSLKLRQLRYRMSWIILVLFCSACKTTQNRASPEGGQVNMSYFLPLKPNMSIEEVKRVVPEYEEMMIMIDPNSFTNGGGEVKIAGKTILFGFDCQERVFCLSTRDVSGFLGIDGAAVDYQYITENFDVTSAVPLTGYGYMVKIAPNIWVFFDWLKDEEVTPAAHAPALVIEWRAKDY